jgi:hypothetical protein
MKRTTYQENIYIPLGYNSLLFDCEFLYDAVSSYNV